MPEECELVFLFSNPSAPMPGAKRRRDGTKRSHGEWASKNGFRWYSAESLPKEVKEGAMQVEEIEDVDLELVWDPPWTKDMMSDAAKLELNL